jgi:SIR2-like protein
MGDKMNFSDAIDFCLDGDSQVFLGSGFSRGAINLNNIPFKTSNDLKNFFLAECGITDDIDLGIACTEYIDKIGLDQYASFLKKEFVAKTVTEEQKHIASLPWKRFYTTNFDNVLEHSALLSGKKKSTIILSDKPSRHSLKNSCIHINGSIDRLNPEDIANSITLSGASYITNNFTSSPWSHLFRQDFCSAKSIFFIGYSLFDLDISRILFSHPELKEKTFFIVEKNPPKWMINKLNGFGHIYQGNVTDFVAKVKDRQSTYVPKDLGAESFICLKEFANSDRINEATDDDMFKLLFYGDCSSSLVSSSTRGLSSQPYYTTRLCTSKLLGVMEHEKRNVLIHSNLGNGKSLLVEGLKALATDKYFRVFTVLEDNNQTFRELDVLFAIEGKKILIIDGYPQYLGLIEYISKRKDPDTVLCLTSRSVLHDVFYDRLYSFLPENNIFEMDINKLKKGELDSIIKTLNVYGLWGKQSRLSDIRKKSFLKLQCDRQWQAILLNILSSPNIRDKFSSIINEIKNKQDHYQTIITILVLNSLGTRLNISKLYALLDDQPFNNNSFRKNPLIREIFDFKRDNIVIKSSVLSRYLLNSSADSYSIVNILILLAKRAESLRNVDPAFDRMFRALTVFGEIQHLLPNRNKIQAVNYYFENIKNMNSCKTNPYFWLQYAIARLVFKDFEKAKVFFDTAYSFAESREHFNPYQIDNHYARYLLDRSIYYENDPNFTDIFRKAAQIINRQILEKRYGHYPFKIARDYLPFYQKYQDKMSDEVFLFVKNHCEFILQRSTSLPLRIAQNKNVLECQKNLETVLHEIQSRIA